MLNFTGSYILNDLTPSTQYSIYVTAVRLVGANETILEGKNSTTATVKTLSKKRNSDTNNYPVNMHLAIVGLFSVDK